MSVCVDTEGWSVSKEGRQQTLRFNITIVFIRIIANLLYLNGHHKVFFKKSITNIISKKNHTPK